MTENMDITRANNQIAKTNVRPITYQKSHDGFDDIINKLNVQPANIEESQQTSRSGMTEEAAQEVENFFVSFMFNIVFDKIPVNKLFGGGFGEKTWRPYLIEKLTENGSFGIKEELLK